MIALVAVSLVLLGIRLWAASVVGFGDSEALYASWALHPQPAYLDHPGLVGVVARAIGEGAAPTPGRVHVVTAIVATGVPWIVHLAARALGAEKRNAIVAAIVVAVIPEMSVGLFALTPDLVLAPAWLGAIALAAVGLRAKPAAPSAVASFLGAGLLAGIAASAKISGLLLVAALAAAYALIARTKHEEARALRTIWPWAGLLAGLVVVAPVFAFEAQSGFPMFRHRLVDSQRGAGFARLLGNTGSLAGGQLLYLSPLLAWLAVILARSLYRSRREDALSQLLFACFAVPLLPLLLLCLWSPVAEPHWIAPALLALPLHAARAPGALSGARESKLLRWGTGVAAILTLVVHGWVLVPASARVLPDDADPKIDIANELYGWPSVLEGVKTHMKLAATPYDPEGREVAVVGPHWTICAQLHAAMPGVRVGCATPIPDDFDHWLPRDEWRNAGDVLWVTDNRFHGDGAEQLPKHVRSYEGHVRVQRGGRTVRVFTLILYSKQASSLREDEIRDEGGEVTPRERRPDEAASR